MRVANWTERLFATIDEWRQAPFEYGRHDCCLFAARCVDAMTGSNWVGDLAACYTDDRSALRYIASEGGIEASVTRRLGEPVARLQARRGDVCLIETPEGEGLGVCVGAVVLAASRDGLLQIPLGQALKAWRVD